jgi:hypothetical protein
MEQIINRKILNINTQDMNSKTALMLGKYLENYFLKKVSLFYPTESDLKSLFHVLNNLTVLHMHLFSVRHWI